jgi:3'(2'), 5'-bisphosphate nucleotidase
MALLNKQFVVETKSVGSSLKFCQIAEGGADLYPRLAPTSEWDTGAAQAVVTAAGGLVVDDSFAELQYNTKENILNPFFYVLADADYDWQKLLSNID